MTGGKTIFTVSLSLVLVLTLTSITNAELIGWWKLDGNYLDSSGNGHHGAPAGNPTFVEGQLGQAIRLNENTTDQYINCGPELGITTIGDGGLADGFSIAAWVNRSLAGGDHKICGNLSVTTWAAGEGFQFAIYNDRTELDMRDSTGRYFSRDVDAALFTVLEADTWYHIVFVFDDVANTLTEYINGERTHTLTNVPTSLAASSNDFLIGSQTPNFNADRVFRGMIDDFRLYDNALNDTEILAVMQGGGVVYPFASNPDPIDGAILTDTWANLKWSAGDFAGSHDVYFGENLEDVNNGTGDTFQGNQTTTFFAVGSPGSPYPEGLITGRTYYWRVDEVNETDPNSPWKGDVWSFMVPPINAYNQNPPDGAFFVDPDVELSWTPGFNAVLHTVYFGDNFEDVNNVTGEDRQAFTTFTPGPLEPDKMYYWRVDEFDITNTVKGDVWSFKTAKEGGGVRADYYRDTNFRNLVMTRIDPQINFDWGMDSAPDASLFPDDDFSVRWTGEIEAAFTEPYTFYTVSGGAVRLWVDDQLIIDNWVVHPIFLDSGTIDLVSGNMYSITMEYYHVERESIAELRWESHSTTTEFVPQAAFSPPVKASSPNPSNMAVDTKQQLILMWGAGDHAVSHQVYFGTDEESVRNANTGSPEYKGTRTLGSETYDPGQLEWDTTYYWRIDEINDLNPESPWTGNLWRFTTANFLIVDNFEDYNDYAPDRIFDFWIDGYGTTTNGSTIGYAEPDFNAGEHFVETTIVHTGDQSMPYFYDNSSAGNSEATLTLTDPTDWTEKDVDTLTLWFRGYTDSVGSFTENPAGTYTITASGTDVWDTADEFHYAFKTLSGAGTIIAKVESIENTDVWAKAGVMIRETLDPGSKNAFVCVTPGNGVASQGRTIEDSDSFSTNQGGINAPHWVQLERNNAGTFTASHSADGTTWEPIENAIPENIQMGANVYIGLALTSHNTDTTCQATFSNVTMTGMVGPQWMNQDIGIISNDAERMYVVLDRNAIVYHDNPNASQISEWMEWNIDLQRFADQGVNLTDVDSIGIGFGDRSNPQPGGSGLIYFDDIHLYAPSP